jgi:hypothetical protein
LTNSISERGHRTLASGRSERYYAAVGLLVPTPEAFDVWDTMAVFEARAADPVIELPRDLPQIRRRTSSRLDSDHYRHRVALAVKGGGWRLLEHVCADGGSRRHARPGEHSWGDSGHEADDLAFSLLCLRYGDRGYRLVPGLFDVIARLSRGDGWRMEWDPLVYVALRGSELPSIR